MLGKRITIVTRSVSEYCGIASYTEYLLAGINQSGVHGIQLSVVACGREEIRDYPNVESYQSVTEPVSFDEIYVSVARTKPNVVHIQHEYGIFGADEQFIQLLRRLRDLNCAIIVTMHTVHTNLSVDLGCGWTRGFSLSGASIEAYQRRLGELADLIIVHHDTSIRRTLIRQGVPSHKVTTIPHGSLLVERRSARGSGGVDLPIGRPLIVVPGYLRKSKNVEMVIDAFARVAAERTSAMLWIGGFLRGEPLPEARAYVDRCAARAADLGLRDNFIIARDPVSEEGMTQVLSAADAVLCVYDEDTRSTSGILHRAIGAGAIVVGSRTPKFQELAEICDELLVNPNRPAELAELLGRILDDPPFAAAVRNVLAELAARTAWPVVATTHLRTYEDTLKMLITDPRLMVLTGTELTPSVPAAR